MIALHVSHEGGVGHVSFPADVAEDVLHAWKVQEYSIIFSNFYRRFTSFSNVKSVLRKIYDILMVKRSRPSIKRDIGRQSLKILIMLGSESWNDLPECSGR